jgi:hypothetical protein
MPSNNRRITGPFVIYLIILFGLIYMFHVELLVTGIRLYVLGYDSARAERLLGDYYFNNASLNNELARNFYSSALRKYKEQLNTSGISPAKVALIKYRIGQFYQCGKGLPPYATEAKRWYTEALQSADLAKEKQEVPFDEKMLNELKANMSIIDQSISLGTSLPPCAFPSQSDILYRSNEIY